MGDVLKQVGSSIVTGATLGFVNLMDEEEDDALTPKTAAQLNREAEKEAEKKRLARTSEKSTKGKTMFSDPLVAGGMPLKDKLGA
jgi:hypothetical protein